MKKLFYLPLILFIITGTSYSTEYSVSSLYITLYDGALFTASIDGKEIGNSVDETQVDELPEGRYFLKVSKQSQYGNSSKQVFIFSDYVFIPAGYSLFAVIDDGGKFYIYKKAEYNPYANHNNWHQTNKCECNCDACRNCIYKVHDPVIEYNNDDCRYKAMKDSDFNNLVSTVTKLSFESSQIEVVKQAVDKNILTSAQVKQLIKIFAFDESKVEIAKYAYKNTCDKNNYFNIYDSFAFESSIIEVKNYIEGK
ncbi:MAG: DUF4476 domain-containing protein [Ignavibacteriae bacterium]|nr:MAG: DUF4476 domain-containing protein [Ignavibacteriota bacterium]